VRHRLGLGHSRAGPMSLSNRPHSEMKLKRNCFETFFLRRFQCADGFRRHLFLQAPQWPGCAVLKRFRRDHCCRGESKPVRHEFRQQNRTVNTAQALICLAIVVFLSRLNLSLSFLRMLPTASSSSSASSSQCLVTDARFMLDSADTYTLLVSRTRTNVGD